jgi:hypothetical protein
MVHRLLGWLVNTLVFGLLNPRPLCIGGRLISDSHVLLEDVIEDGSKYKRLYLLRYPEDGSA